MKVTAYVAAVRSRADRAVIRDEWIERAIGTPIREYVQADGRIREVRETERGVMTEPFQQRCLQGYGLAETRVCLHRR